MSNSDNGKKSKRGSNARQSLNRAIDELEHSGAVSEVRDSPEYGYQGLQPNQFKADKELALSDGTHAVLFSTASLRSDRVRTKQWAAHNIKQVSQVKYAFIILPDESSYDMGTTPRDEIRNGEVYSAIDDIFTIDEFYDFAITSYGAVMDAGKAHDMAGKSLEALLVSVLCNSDNLKRLHGDETATGYMYGLFWKVMKAIGVRAKNIVSLSATSDIPALANGGRPKTDVALTVIFANGDEEVFTFSLKNSSNKSVTVHEYTADAFADVLDKDNTELRRLLRAFQAAGSRAGMNPKDAEGLRKALRPYKGPLNLWVFGGYGGQYTSDIQLAQYMITHDKKTNRFAVHSIRDYIALLESENSEDSGFGTIYSWTYPSKKRGKSIQLKAKMRY